MLSHKLPIVHYHFMNLWTVNIEIYTSNLQSVILALYYSSWSVSERLGDSYTEVLSNLKYWSCSYRTEDWSTYNHLDNEVVKNSDSRCKNKNILEPCNKSVCQSWTQNSCQPCVNKTRLLWALRGKNLLLHTVVLLRALRFLPSNTLAR